MGRVGTGLWKAHCRECGHVCPIDDVIVKPTAAGPCDSLEYCPECESGWVDLFESDEPRPPESERHGAGVDHAADQPEREDEDE